MVSIHNISCFNSFTSEGKVTETIDEQGNFSFVGYEGYEYIIHAHALDSKGNLFHAKHQKIKIVENMQPLELKLSIEGKGDNKEEITQEIDK
jgi:hypothetical protein